MNTTTNRQVITLCRAVTVLCLLALSASAQSSGGQFQLTQSVVAGGGGQNAAGGAYSLDATAGQAAAGTPMSAGDFFQLGGFWAADLSSVPPPMPIMVAAGATLVNEGCPPVNGMIDPGEVVTVNLNLMNNGSVSTNSLVATLQPSGNVLVPSGPRTYGTLAPGATAGASFSFSANGNSGDQLTLTLQLQDGAASLGTVSYAFTLGGNTACAGAPRIITSTSLSCGGGDVVANITLSNSGTVAATNVALTTAKLGAVNGAPLPQAVGTLAPGASAVVTVTFTGAPGGATSLQVGGTYDGGTFSGNRRVTAPNCP